MAFPITYALTGAEFSVCSSLPKHCAWMACHYGCYTTGLSNCPDNLPAGSMLIINDRTPPQGHDPQRIAQQLLCIQEQLKFKSVLLDFQRSDLVENAAVAKAVTENLSCPVGVSALYAKELNCPVFLPPPPLHQSPEDYLRPWQEREIWLEAALTSEIITVTPSGSQIDCLSSTTEVTNGFDDPLLYCRYQIDASPERGIFTLVRTPEHLLALLQKAESLGVTQFIGLYQELWDEKTGV